MSRCVYRYESVIGPLFIADNGDAVTNVEFSAGKIPSGPEERETPLQREVLRQITEYLAGKRTQFDLPLAPSGTPFQLMAWNALLTIPYGETRSYKDMAEAVGNKGAFRAAGLANNRNPIAIIIPCHRVIGSDGKLVGYGGGLDMKKKLLEMEYAVRTQGSLLLS